MIYYILLFEVVSLSLVWLSNHDEPNEDTPLLYFFTLVPIIGQIITLVSIYGLIYKFHTHPTCVLGHHFKLIYDSEAQKWKNGRRPIRISMSGMESYKCRKCKATREISWSAL